MSDDAACTEGFKLFHLHLLEGCWLLAWALDLDKERSQALDGKLVLGRIIVVTETILNAMMSGVPAFVMRIMLRDLPSPWSYPGLVDMERLADDRLRRPPPPGAGGHRTILAQVMRPGRRPMQQVRRMGTARRDNDMSTTEQGPLTPEEQEVLAATAERVRQLRRHAGIPDGMSVEKAIAWHIISPDELERARRGPTQTRRSHGVSQATPPFIRGGHSDTG